ncbi:MAG: leucine-rich repeat domain-containing protein [Clostridia bacterium]|nr:leucine-rich repeat domain-containing protein [Clostridia bacterium]
MKKKILLVFAMVLLFVCIFALSVNAETTLKSQATNAYGELSFFDESVTVGRTDPKYGFTPYMDAEGTTYARIVVGDGTTYYTFPTAYALSNSKIYGSGEKTIMFLDLTSLNSAMETATGTNPGWSKASIYRIELPKNMQYLNAGEQNFQSCTNVIEIYLQPNSSVKDNDKNMVFWKCHNLEIIHNLDTFVFRKGTLSGSFQECRSLTNITIGVSPEVTGTGDNVFNGCTNLQSVNFKEAFPNLTSLSKNVFYKCTNLVSTSSEENIVSLPNGVTKINENSFYECKSMKYLALPTSLSYIGGATFRYCTSLEFVDFGDNQNTFTSTSYGIFRDCTSLKAICLPDGMVTIPDQAFANCTSLTAVYLPARVEVIKGNKDDGPAFGGTKSENACNYLFFTNEKFSVRDENGNFYTAETFEIPEKPTVYYFPSTLKAICGPGNANNNPVDENGMKKSGTGNNDKGIMHCPNLNSILVLPEGFTGYADQSSGNAIIDENQRGDTLTTGLLTNCSSKDNPITLVFLGKIDRVSLDRKDGNTKYTTYVFANEANTGFDDTLVGSSYNTSTEYKNQDEMYVIFCHANNGAGAKYKVTFKGSDTDKKYPVLVAELQDGATHIIEPNATAIVSNPTCTLGTVMNTFCFCGNAIDTNKEIVGTALGHEYDLAKGAVKSNIEYTNYLANGTLYTQCARCEECQKSEVNPLIADFKGFSVNYDGDGITFGYVFDDEAIKEFETVNKTTLEFGFVAGVKEFIGDKNPLDEGATNVVSTAIDSSEYSAADFVLRGDWDRNVTIGEAEVNVKDVEFYMAGYMTFGDTVVYLNASGSSNSAASVTFAQFDVPEAVE